MPHYIAFIDGQKGGYGAHFPDAPGCTAMGPTSDAVLENAGAALREWMADRIADGLEVPRARSYDEILEDDSTGWGKATAFALVDLLLDAGRTVRANISINAGLLEQIDDAAKRRGLTRSAFLASAAREKIAARR